MVISQAVTTVSQELTALMGDVRTCVFYCSFVSELKYTFLFVCSNIISYH